MTNPDLNTDLPTAIPVFRVEMSSDIDPLVSPKPIDIGLYTAKGYVSFPRRDSNHDIVWDFLQYLKSNHKGIRLFSNKAANSGNRIILDCLVKRKEGLELKGTGGPLLVVWSDICFEDASIATGLQSDALCKAYGIDGYSRASLEQKCTKMSKALSAYNAYTMDKFGLEITSSSRGQVSSFSSLALQIVKKFSPIPWKNVDRNDTYWAILEKVPTGMRTEVFSRYAENVYFHDTNSQFPSTYDTPVPVGPLQRLPDAKLHIDRGSFAKARVKIPKDWFIGPLPYYLNERLIFPVGEFEGWWDMYELRNAAKQGADVILLAQLEGDELPILKEFGSYLLDLKDEAKNPYLRRHIGLLAVRGSQKLGQKTQPTAIKHYSTLTIKEWFISDPIDEEDTYHEIPLQGEGPPSSARWAISSRIRAVSRLRHTNMLMNVPPDRLAYCDTDSIHSTLFLGDSNVPGELKLVDKDESPAIRAYYIKPKFYGWSTKAGVVRQTTSGFMESNLSEEHFKKLLDGESISITQVKNKGWKDILKSRGELVEAKTDIVKPISQYPNRVYYGNNTEPICLPLPTTTIIPVETLSPEVAEILRRG